MNDKILTLLQDITADADLAAYRPEYRRAALEILCAADDVNVSAVDAIFVHCTSPSQHTN